MNRAELIESISNKAKLTKEDSVKFVDAFVNEITKELRKGRRIRLVGFGTFSVTKKNERVCMNPKTGEPVNVPSKKVVKFKAGLELKELINQQ